MPKNQGGCLVSVIAFFVGYIGPSAFGLGAAKLIRLGYAVTVLWVTLLSGVRGILVRRGGSGDSQNLRRLTLIPHFIWFLVWLSAAVGAVAVGGSWLVTRT